jgi:tetratricopeptide (TPR) repeat protein
MLFARLYAPLRQHRTLTSTSFLWLILIVSFSSLWAQNSVNGAASSFAAHFEAARKYAQEGNLTQSDAEYKKFLALALRALGSAQAKAGLFADAEESFLQAREFSPNDNELALDLAIVELERGKVEDASTLARSVKSDDKSGRLQFVLGRVAYLQGDFGAARVDLEKAASTSPNLETAYALGTVYLKLKDLQHAHLLFDEMLRGLGDTPQLRLLIGRAYRDAEFWNESIAEFKSAIVKHPKARQLHYFLGLAYLGRDNDSGIPQALPEFQAELKNNPDDARSHYMLGYCLVKQENIAGAEREFLRAQELDPQNPDPVIYLGQLYSEQNRKPEAEQAMRKAIALTADESRNYYQIHRAHYVLGRLLLEKGESDEAKRELSISDDLRKRGLQKTAERQQASTPAGKINEGLKPSAVETVHSMKERQEAEAFAAQLRPALADAANNLGVSAASRKDYASALVFFKTAGKWNPSLETIDRNLGMAAFYGGKFQEAIGPLALHIERRPDDLRARAALGLCYFSLEDYPHTVATLEPLEKTAMSDPGLASAYGTSLVKVGQFERGTTFLKSAENSESSSAESHRLLGSAYADQGIYAKAIEQYRKAVAMDPGMAQAHFLLGLALIHQGSPAEAIPALRTALELQPADVAAKYHLAFSLMQVRQTDEAKNLLMQVIKQDPKHGDAYYQLGKLELERGDTKSAIASLEAGIKLKPQSDYMHYQLAIAFRRDSRPEDAKREMALHETLKAQRKGDHENGEIQ